MTICSTLTTLVWGADVPQCVIQIRRIRMWTWGRRMNNTYCKAMMNVGMLRRLLVCVLFVTMLSCSSYESKVYQPPSCVVYDMQAAEWSVQLSAEQVSWAALPSAVPIRTRLTNGTVVDGILSESGTPGSVSLGLYDEDRAGVRIRLPHYCEKSGSSWTIADYRTAHLPVIGKMWREGNMKPLKAWVFLRRPGGDRPDSIALVEGEGLKR